MANKKITVVICVDDRLGMMFNKRRQSRDRILIGELCDSVSGKIYITEYSTLLFKDREDKVIVCSNPLAECPDGAVCFIENLAIRPYLDEIGRMIVYRWNRLYPSDVRLDVELDGDGFKLVSESEFVGSSHDRITKGIYEK